MYDMLFIGKFLYEKHNHITWILSRIMYLISIFFCTTQFLNYRNLPHSKAEHLPLFLGNISKQSAWGTEKIYIKELGHQNWPELLLSQYPNYFIYITVFRYL